MLLWDAHATLILNHYIDIKVLEQHRKAGFSVVSINIAMDMNPLSQIMSVVSSFRRQIAENSDKYIQIETIADVDKAKAEGKLAVHFDIEGGVCFQEDPGMVEVFSRLGVRQAHLAYNRDNSLAGGCHGADIGLTDLGKKMVKALNKHGVLMDMSHTGYRSSLDIMEYSEKPAIFSHTNPKGKFGHTRTITKEQAQKCAATGGIIGITGLSLFLEDLEAKSSTMADHLETLIEWTSIDNVGFGLDFPYHGSGGLHQFPPTINYELWWPKKDYADFAQALAEDAGTPKKDEDDGGVMPLDAIKFASPEQAVETLEILKTRGYSDDDLEKIAGMNFYRVAKETWNN